VDLHTITIVIESDADPSQVLDEAIRVGETLADILDGSCDETQVSVGTVNGEDVKDLPYHHRNLNLTPLEGQCIHCENPADGVDGKCMFHSSDDLSSVA
jgi:hypothetical protein